MMWRLADLIEKHTKNSRSSNPYDNGKPPTRIAASPTFPSPSIIFRYYAGWAS